VSAYPSYSSLDLICYVALSGLLCFLLVATGCDQAPQEPAQKCTTFEGCTTLSGLSSVRDEPFVATDALVHDSTLYVAITSMTRRFDGQVFEPDDIFVLSRPVGPNAGPPDSSWTMQRLTNDPTTRFGGMEGLGSLAVDPSGTLRYVWGELVPYDSTATRSPAKTVWESSLTGMTWTNPMIVAELEGSYQTLIGPQITGELQLVNKNLFLPFLGTGSTAFGDARSLVWSNGMWTKQRLFEGNITQPSVAFGLNGIAVALYVEVGASSQDEPEGILSRVSLDGGTTWSEPVQIKSGGSIPENTFTKVHEPQVVVDPIGDYHALFTFDTPPLDYFGDQVWHTVSRDGGRSWTSPTSINTSDRGYVSQLSVATTPSDTVHIVYLQGPHFASPSGNTVRHSIWNGTQWQQQPDLSTRSIMFDQDIGIASTSDPSGCVYALWDEFTNWDAKTSRFRYERLGC
jgi:hypothetical protein